ncbi:MAG: hypothetical protein A2Z14_08040 [Chloroflexi bacterium RBG_16_48_8]|nr:MAG: hypothetical protein A2Z14_08040 [Chloroflexi bacterium RBG_16_48_8]
MSSIPDAEIILAVDVGSVNTRASLFDVVDGRYRLVATSEVSSTAGPPLFDIGEGVRLAMDRIRVITGRRLTDETEVLIYPSTGFGSGVDLFVSSISAGPKVKTIIAGLMPGVSMTSARRLAESAYLDIVGEITLVDRRRTEEQIDLILSQRPDMILIVGGTDGGASDPLFQLIELIKLAVSLLPEGQKPRIVYSGNRNLGALVVDRLSGGATVNVTPNIRPSLEMEELTPARLRLAETLFEIRSNRITGYEELKQWSGDALIPTAEAFGRLIRYLSKVYHPDKGVLGVDLGASQVTIAAAFEGDLNLSVNSRLGAGSSITGLLENGDLFRVMRWLPHEVSDSQLKDYIHNKAIRQGSIPVTIEELHIELAIARQLIRQALFNARQTWPAGKDSRSMLLLPEVEPILAGGASLARAPRPGYSALVLLDALQPTGVSTLVMDPYSLAPTLGATAGPLPLATVQLLEAGVFVSTGTVVAPKGKIRQGRKVLSYQLEYEDGSPTKGGEVNYNQIEVLPLATGQYGRLTLRPEGGVELGFGLLGRAGTLRVAGGTLGVMIDARGRPLNLPRDLGQLRELNQRWLWDIGALE